jgi:copper chaperone CopZ
VTKARIDFDQAKADVEYNDEYVTAEQIVRSLEVRSDGRYKAQLDPKPPVDSP